MSKKIIVTGGTKGIGRAIIDKFINQGYDVATCSRNVKELDNLKDELKQNYPNREIWTKPCDVTQAPQITRWCADLALDWDRCDILINNAGTFLPGSVLTEDEAILQLQLETNLLSAYRFTRGLITMLRNNNHGHIFNMCSIASQNAYPHGGAYTISKFALYGFSQCLREELKPTAIKVTSVLPGATWSDSWKGSKFTPEDMINSTDIADLIWSCSQLSKQAVVEEIRIRPQGGDL